MRLFGLRAICVAVAAVATTADAAVEQAQQQTQQQVQIQTQADGTVVITTNGDDGQAVRVIADRIEVQEVPADIKQKLDKAREAADKQADEIRQDADKLRDKKAKPDEAQKAIDRLKKQIEQGQQQGGDGINFGMQGSITIIGPDGVKHTQKFEKFGAANGNGKMPDVQGLIEKALQAAGADLPEEVRDKLKQALKQQGNMQMQMQLPGTMKPKLDEADISRKLDRILDRLEKLEADVGEIRGAKAGKPDEAAKPDRAAKPEKD